MNYSEITGFGVNLTIPGASFIYYLYHMTLDSFAYRSVAEIILEGVLGNSYLNSLTVTMLKYHY